MLNRIDLDGFKKVQKEYRKDRSKCKKTLEVKGRWRLDVDYGPQFETKLKKLDIRIVADIDLTTGFGIEDGIDAVDNYKLEIFVESDAPIEKLNEVLEATKKRCFCMYCITTPIVPNIDMIVEFPEERIEEAVFICPTCFNKTMVFLDDNTQKCKNCG